MHPGAHDPASTALVFAGSGATVTYGELDARANQVSHLLREIGVEVEDHVALTIENRPEMFDVAWGAHYAGTYYTATSTRLNGEEIAYIVDDCGAKVFVLSARYADRGEQIKALTPKVEEYLSLGGEIPGYEPIEPLLEAQPTTPLEGRTAGRDMLYSSGTTGKPKGIKPSDLAMPIDEAPIIVTPVLKNMLGIGADDVYLSPAPLYHAAPLRFCLAIHQLGGKVVVLERFTPEDTLRVIEEQRVTVTQMVPTMFVRLLRLPKEQREAADVSSLKVVIHAAAPCPVDVKHAMIEWWGPLLHEYYASTEGAGMTWITSPEWLEHPGSVGKAVIGKVHVLADEEDTELDTGATGRVFYSEGPKFEYHNAPEKTKEAYSSQGWATAGDIGHVDEGGFLYLTDRASFMIISGGVNIYPQEAENALAAHDKVMDAAVFGVPHEEWGEEVKGVVQPTEMPADDAAAEALEAELIAYLKERLADVKVPRSIDFRAELPRHETGKLYKRLLKDEYAAAATA